MVRLLKDQAVIRVNEKFQKTPKGVDDSNRQNGKLFSVVPVNKKEAEFWYRQQKKSLNNNQESVQNCWLQTYDDIAVNKLSKFDWNGEWSESLLDNESN